MALSTIRPIRDRRLFREGLISSPRTKARKEVIIQEEEEMELGNHLADQVVLVPRRVALVGHLRCSLAEMVVVIVLDGEALGSSPRVREPSPGGCGGVSCLSL